MERDLVSNTAAENKPNLYRTFYHFPPFKSLLSSSASGPENQKYRRSLGGKSSARETSEMPEARVTLRVGRSASDCRTSRQEKAVMQTRRKEREPDCETDGGESGTAVTACLIPANGCKHRHKHPLLSHAGLDGVHFASHLISLFPCQTEPSHKHAQIHTQRLSESRGSKGKRKERGIPAAGTQVKARASEEQHQDD